MLLLIKPSRKLKLVEAASLFCLPKVLLRGPKHQTSNINLYIYIYIYILYVYCIYCIGLFFNLGLLSCFKRHWSCPFLKNFAPSVWKSVRRACFVIAFEAFLVLNLGKGWERAYSNCREKDLLNFPESKLSPLPVYYVIMLLYYLVICPILKVLYTTAIFRDFLKI